MTFAIESFARSSIVLSFGLMLLAFTRHQPAAFRHWILAGAIGLAALQPAANVMMPSWTVPAIWAPAAVSTPQPGPAVGAAAEMTEKFEVIGPAAPRTASADPATWLLRLWGVGVLVNLGVLFVAALWLAWLGRRGRSAGGAWPQAADEIAISLAVSRRVRMRVTPHPALLVTWGVINPVILLPKDAESWRPDRVRLVLAHELAHVARHDWLVQVIAEGARAVFWPNPLFWLACARLRAESEQACDDAVLRLGISQTSYASHLVELARSFSGHGRTWLPAPSMARPSTLERRVVAMLNTNINRRPISRWRRTFAVAALVAAALPVAAAATRTAGAPSGVLRDPSGRVLPGATVRLSAIGAEATHDTQSDSTGAFQFPEVPDGDYMLSARLPGFQSGRQRIRVSPSMAPLNLTLPVGMLKETVTVKSGDTEIPPSPARPMPSAPPCGSTQLGGNIKPPMKLRSVAPRYRPEWKANNVEGDVLLQVVIDTDGKVRNLEVVSPVHPDLEEEALWAVSEWQFSPTYLNCQAVEVRMFVTVSFKLDR
jgi:TonB family protein